MFLTWIHIAGPLLRYHGETARPIEMVTILGNVSSKSMQDVYARRQARDWASRLYRSLKPPDPFICNPAELLHFPLGRWNLYVGGGGSEPEGYINIDLFALPGVDVAADAENLPFPSGMFQCIECDAVLEHVRHPDQVMRELSRVLAKGRTSASGHAVLSSVSPVSARLPPLHAGRAKTARGGWTGGGC